jgi:tetratricopeptide (TPR) repeat protein
MRRFDEARRVLDRALELMPESQQAHLQTILLRLSMGDTAGTRAALRQASGIVPERIRHGFLAQLALLARDDPLAYRETEQRESEFGAAYLHRSLHLAIVAAARGDSALARVHADSLLQLGAAELELRRLRGGVDPFGRRSQIEGQMAAARAIRGERDAAVSLAEEAARRFSTDRDAIDGVAPREYLAWTYMFAGRRAEAIATLQSLLAMPSQLTVPLVRMDPMYDSLRGERAFQQLIGK